MGKKLYNPATEHTKIRLVEYSDKDKIKYDRDFYFIACEDSGKELEKCHNYLDALVICKKFEKENYEDTAVK